MAYYEKEEAFWRNFGAKLRSVEAHESEKGLCQTVRGAKQSQQHAASNHMSDGHLGHLDRCLHTYDSHAAADNRQV